MANALSELPSPTLLWGVAASWCAAMLAVTARLAQLEWKRSALRAASPRPAAKRPRDEAHAGRPPSPSGDGWTVVAGEKWEGRFWWRACDELGADPGEARVFAGWGERHAGPLCVKVAPRGGQLFNDRVVWSALQASGRFEAGGLPRLHAHLRCVGSAGGDEALVSELCGRSLAWHLARAPSRRLPPADALLVGAELLRLVGCCHAAGYAHRDITPANLLTPAAGRARAPDGALLHLIDFGISERLPRTCAAAGEARAPRAQDRSGTLRFATPHLGTAPLARRDDVLGVCFVTLACAAGSLPWDAAMAAAPAAAAGGRAAAQARAQARVRVAVEKLRFLREAAAQGAGGAERDGAHSAWWAALGSSVLRDVLRSCVAAATSLGADSVPDYCRMREALLAARARELGARALAAEAERGAPELACVRDAAGTAISDARLGAAASRPARTSPQPGLPAAGGTGGSRAPAIGGGAAASAHGQPVAAAAPAATSRTTRRRLR